jgi:phage/plasmid-like protein (TIGR03299 family)
MAFAAEKRGQVTAARAIVERNRADIASYDSGATQAAIDQRLASQVAEGKIEMISTDRYRVLVGYDANETFSVQRATRPGEIPLILPETGLDMNADGTARLYLSKQPAWHGLGQVVPEGTSDIEEVLRLSGGDYPVGRREVRYAFGGKRLSDLRTVPGQFVTINEDTGHPFGVVGSKYTIVQNTDSMRFLQELTAKGDAVFDSAGPLREGAKFFVSMRLPEDVVIDAEGVHDTLRPYVAVINSHDGSGMFKALVTPWMIVCGNTERFAVRDAHTSWGVRHTANALQRIEEARRSLGLTVKYYDRWAAEEQQLVQIDLELDAFQELIKDLYDRPDAERRAALGRKPSKHNDTTKRTDTLNAMFERESARVGRTAYAAERTVTDYLDHAAPKRMLNGSLAAARATAIMEGSDDAIKSQAHQRLMRLT